MLRVEKLEVAYGRLQALWGVSFDVREGEIVALVGANGAGKTTTLKTLSGLLHPKGGSIWLGAERVDRRSPAEIAELGVVHVPEGRKLFPGMTVLENLMMGSYPRPARPHRQRRLEEVFAIFPTLFERQRQMAGTLSGGEQQMVAIGRALMARPRCLLLDEPSVGLAPLMVAEIFRVIETLKGEGLSMLLVEQNARAAFRIADRGYALEPGGRLGRADRAAHEAYGLELVEEGIQQ
jgi:branched-chain amino acid transport system ATP-binding protein